MSIHVSKILCATDFSPFSAAALDAAQHLAAMFQAHLTVFHSVFHPRHQPYGISVFDHLGQNRSECDAALIRINAMMIP